MHEYTFSHSKRQRVWIVLFVIAVAISLAYRWIVSMFPILEIPSYLEGPSILTMYGVLAWFYETKLWNKKYKRLRFSSMPDYNGCWRGTIHSSYNGGTDVPCELIVKQTWLTMSCELRTQSSRSYSIQAAVSEEVGLTHGLTWYYVNNPKNTSGIGMHMHFGVTHATMNGDSMECEYFNRSKDRDTYGTIELKRK